MSTEKKGPTHSQILGIIWLSVALLIIAAVAFFSPRQAGDEGRNDTCERVRKELLVEKEDSAFRSRRTYRYKSHNYNQKHSNTQATTSPVPGEVAEGRRGHHSTTQPLKQPLKVELNGADTLTLQLLHGIGPVYAQRIVRYRDRLGGFVSPTQLLEVYGFTPDLLAHISPYLELDSSAVNRIDINSVGLKQLAKHPYIEYYQARDIIRLRNNGTLFRNADDLRAVPSMADSTLHRLLPYLDFSDSTATK